MYHAGGARIPLSLNVVKHMTTAQCILAVAVWRPILRIITLTILRRLAKITAHMEDEVTHLCCFRSRKGEFFTVIESHFCFFNFG